MEQLFSLDRIEGSYAVLQDENGQNTEISRALLPADAAEGDLFRPVEDGRWIFCPDETEQKKADVMKRLEALWKE